MYVHLFVYLFVCLHLCSMHIIYECCGIYEEKATSHAAGTQSTENRPASVPLKLHIVLD